jgi:uncharacterized membrane protein YjgN (DUF898 family)
MEQSSIKEYPVSFYGESKEFFRIWIVNVLLSVVTLGIYSAWAKVRTRKYFYGNIELAEHRFDYHASPVQILKGRVVAVACVLVWYFSSQLYPALSLLIMAVFFLLSPILIRNNARFDAAMTSYRNERFSFAGSLSEAYLCYVGRPLVSLLVLYCMLTLTVMLFSRSIPVGIMMILATMLMGSYLWGGIARRITEYHIDNYQYGEHYFTTNLSGRYFVVTYLLATGIALVALLMIGGMAYVFSDELIQQVQMEDGELDLPIYTVTVLTYAVSFVFGIIANAIIRVRIRNYVFAQTAFHLNSAECSEKQQPSSAMTLSSYLWLVSSNFLAQLFTLGLARPWVLVRTQTYFAEVTSLKGDLSALTVTAQSSSPGSAVADEVVQAFDMDLGL